MEKPVAAMSTLVATHSGQKQKMRHGVTKVAIVQ